ncbi:hypothetical protein QBC38DRAFT_465988 [Podospora fimiseda]|uniref:Transmembrane protein n=1 Tax=Podospora fimiseda TaxID=252190 RepID=A0AAN7BYA5_9PEZI|nr:hypothetical protein QBC38DRAFT_465988 [Podospora fimiseda]
MTNACPKELGKGKRGEKKIRMSFDKNQNGQAVVRFGNHLCFCFLLLEFFFLSLRSTPLVSQLMILFFNFLGHVKFLMDA